MFNIYLRCVENGKVIGLWTEEFHSFPQVAEKLPSEEIRGFYNPEEARRQLQAMISENKDLYGLGLVRDFTFETVRATVVVNFEVV